MKIRLSEKLVAHSGPPTHAGHKIKTADCCTHALSSPSRRELWLMIPLENAISRPSPNSTAVLFCKLAYTDTMLDPKTLMHITPVLQSDDMIEAFVNLARHLCVEHLEETLTQAFILENNAAAFIYKKQSKYKYFKKKKRCGV